MTESSSAKREGIAGGLRPAVRACRWGVLAAAAIAVVRPVWGADPPSGRPVPSPGSAVSVDAEALPGQNVARQQQVQQRVRAMARELVGGVLDVQLQQLRDNGMTAHPMYAEIDDMHKNLDQLIDRQMPEVIKLLSEMEAGRADPSQTFAAAREKSREIAVVLYVQRQVLLRRLKIAELAAQVKQLIQHQTKVKNDTEALPEQPAARREPLTLAALEDQRDVQAVYTRFFEALQEVSRWTGPFGAEASEAVKMLRASPIDADFAAALAKLQAAAYGESVESQKSVIRTLESLLVRMERAQGLMEQERNAATDRLRELVAEQAKIREATRQSELNQEQADALADRQTAVRKSIAELAEAAAQPEMKRALEKAAEAAHKASEDLFEMNKSEAIEQQNNVVNNLEKAADLADLFSGMESGMTAEQLERRAADLEAARADMARIEQRQNEAQSQADAAKPDAAKRSEAEVARDLAKVSENRDLPSAVDRRLDEARNEASEAAAAQANEVPRQTTEASEAVARAASEIEAAAKDAKREALTAKVAELAYAARALDEAAKAERRIADQAKARENEGIRAEDAKKMAEEQADVRAIAEKAAEGVKHTAPEAAKTLESARPNLESAAKSLDAAAKQPQTPPRRRRRKRPRRRARPRKSWPKRLIRRGRRCAKRSNSFGPRAGGNWPMFATRKATWTANWPRRSIRPPMPPSVWLGLPRRHARRK